MGSHKTAAFKRIPFGRNSLPELLFAIVFNAIFISDKIKETAPF